MRNVLLTVSTTHRPATDLGYLLHKHPDRAQRFATAAGSAYVCYPEASAERCTAALLLDVDPVGLVRGQAAADAAHYVDDRPYAASSLLAVAMAAVFSTAMAGNCKARPELAAALLPLELRVSAVPCRGGGAELAERLFAPLGWQVEATPMPLDPAFPEWGDAPHHDLRLTGTARLADALTQLYVLLPVLDDGKHYYVGPDEIDKLVREGASWLPGHPERGLIARRYLAHQGGLASSALARLAAVDDVAPERVENGFESGRVGPPSLADLRRRAILDVLRSAGAGRVADLGCGDGKLVARLLADPAFTEVFAVDVSYRALELAARRLRLDRMPERVRARLHLLVSSLTYRDARLAGLDAAVLSEVVEHVDPPRLPALAEALLNHARPRLVVVTTPNVEYNVRYGALATGELRHRDHRFEWTRDEFAAWLKGLVASYPYTARLTGVGDDDPEVGQPTQLAVLERTG